eukprot:TRINITY_DN352_c0_g2_i1.p1 TRINITY_DN352_c0_g2~~TRINITY_DN352_c0_g2_i1.p1  ORF type:complete len:478 (+),score=62.90 TRINITY_DN352_c0_g2_i1:126-1559(+)
MATEQQIAEEAVAIAKRRLLPVLCVLYVCAHLDRSNVSFANDSDGMKREVGLTGTEYGLGSGAFDLSYTALQVPANLLMDRVGGRLWLSSLVIVWGIVSSAQALTAGPYSFAVIRFLLGVAEAGYAPGVLYYLTQWFVRSERAKVYSFLFLASPVAGSLGSLLSTLILTQCDGWLGLSGWRWLFILQGLPVSIIGGACVYLFIPDSPRDAKWLSEPHRHAITRLAASEGGRAVRRGGCSGFAQALQDPQTWGLIVLGGIPANIALYGIQRWLPRMVRDILPEHTGKGWIGLLRCVPFVFAAAGVLLFGRYGARFIDSASPTAVRTVAALQCAGCVALVSVAPFHMPWLQLGLLSVSAAFLWAWIPAFWSLTATCLRGERAAAGLAFCNSAAHVGSFLGPVLFGVATDAGRERLGFFLLSLPGVLGSAVAVVCSRRMARRPHDVLPDEWDFCESPQGGGGGGAAAAELRQMQCAGDEV